MKKPRGRPRNDKRYDRTNDTHLSHRDKEMGWEHVKCPTCRGSGDRHGKMCPLCRGTGTIVAHK